MKKFKRSFKRRSFRGRRRYRARVPIVHLRAVVLKDTFVVSTAAINKSYTFSLQDILSTGSTTFSNFEEFRLNKVLLTVMPENTVCNVPTGTANSAYPQIVDCVDYTEDTVLTATADYLRFDNARIHMGDKPFNRKFTPSVLLQVNDSAAGVYNAPKFKQWLSTNSAQSLSHFGYKLQLTPFGGTTSFVRYNVWAKIYYSLKRIH